jgi:ribonucleoside-diphosphate reductase subunit M1
MYNHVNDRSGLEAPLIADDVYEIIMKVIFFSKSCLFDLVYGFDSLIFLVL